MNIATIAEELRQVHQATGPMPVEVRKRRLQSLKKAILKKEVLINTALKNDLGKSTFETYLTESGFILEEIGHILKHIDGWVKPKKVKTPLNLFPAKSFVHAEPYGVVLVISPWNYPFQLCVSPLIGAIAAGNKVVIKPSEFSPHTARVIQDIVTEVFQKDEVVVVEGAVEETQSLLAQKFDYIFFTGSTPVGKIIMKAAAEHLTPVTLELGGKSPLIIDETVDIDLVAKRAVWGKFLNAGQTCVAPDYVLVPREKQNLLVERMGFHLKNFYGERVEASQDYPRIVNEKHFDRLKSLIIPEKIAVGGVLSREDKFIAPTIMKDVAWTDKIMEDEIFGPLLPVIPYESLELAMAEVVKRPKPLAFYLFSEDRKTKNDIISKIPFGGGCINDTVMHLGNPNLPFGGVGSSGIGSYHGKKSFETFSHFKSVLVQNTKVDLPLRYPPYEGKLGWVKMFLR